MAQCQYVFGTCPNKVTSSFMAKYIDLDSGEESVDTNELCDTHTIEHWDYLRSDLAKQDAREANIKPLEFLISRI
jgi:hypothetical protein